MLAPRRMPTRALAGRLRVIQSRRQQRNVSNTASEDPSKGNLENLDALLIGKHTRVIYQGFTGKAATQNAKDSIKYGTKIVGGVKPGTDGEHLGLPVVSSVRAAKEQLKPDATAIFVPMTGAAAAIQEAIEAEIPLIVAVAEHIPVYDMLRIKDMLKGSKSRVVGANSPGIISPLGHCRIGFQPLPMYKPGNVGVIAKSGTLSYEAVGSLTRAGVGQSLCIGCGGDPIAGTTLAEAFAGLIHDENTHALAIIGEAGGVTEFALADMIAEYRKSTPNPKPIAALVGGRFNPPERVMGHAGAYTNAGEPNAEDKYKALEKSGAVMVNHPEQYGEVMKRLIASAPAAKAPSGKRGFHTLRRPVVAAPSASHDQTRSLHLRAAKAKEVLQNSFPKFNIAETASSSATIPLKGSLDRDRAEIMINIGLPSGPRVASQPPDGTATVPSDLEASVKGSQVEALGKHLEPTVRELLSFMQDKEALSVQTLLSVDKSGKPTLSDSVLHFDDAAFKSAKRQEDIFALRDKASEEQAEVEAEKDGIVYVKLYPEDPSATIGTLVNGAGLAMNTADALALPPYNAKCANFLDTGGKATSDTVKKSFELILRDKRLKVIFVNIFGGITDCGMIADGVLLAFKEVDMRGVPVVVRLRGTNEELGQKKIAESGLSLEAFDLFADAAKRVVELSKA